MPRSPLVPMVLVCLLASAVNAHMGAAAGRGVSPPAANAVVGQVVDPSGAPAADVFVTALLPQPRNARGFSIVAETTRAMTDADGQFRLDGLPAGPVYVLAIPHNPLRTAEGAANRQGLGRTFYPSASSVETAETVNVTSSAPASANITLQSTPLYSFSGVVWTQAGTTAGNAFLEMAHGDGLFGLDTRGFTVGANGTFLLPGIAPGTYFLRFHQSAWPPSLDEIPSVSGATVTISDRDVRDVRVAPIHMVTVTGRVVIDRAIAPRRPAAIVVGAAPLDAEGNPGPQYPAALTPDFSFAFKTWPSRGRIHVLPESDWTITSIRVAGAVVPNAFSFAPDTDLADVEVEIVRRRGQAPLDLMTHPK